MKSLSLWMLVSLVIGNMVGSGIFLLPSSLAVFGSISIVAWIFTSIGAMLIAIIFARLSRLSPRAGGPYAYCHEAFGDFVGFEIAYLYWIYGWVGNAAIATSLIGYLSYFFPVISTNHLLSFILIVSIVWILTFINILGVKKAGALQLLTVVLKIIPLIIICFLGIFFINVDYLSAFNLTHQSNFAALSGSAALTMWALTGVESATVPADHVQNPKRNIALATLLGTSVSILLYVLSTVVIMGIIPMDVLSHSSAPFANAAEITVGKWGGTIVALAAIISSVGALNGWILLQGQVPYAASVNKIFPQFFSKLSRHDTPVNALVLSSLLITLLLIMNYNKSLVDKFTSIISLATISILIVYAITILAEIVILIQRREFKHFYKKTSLNMLGLIYIVWACYGSDHAMIFFCMILAISGVPIYLYTRRLEKSFV